MDIAAIILLFCTYYIRPQDWVPGMVGMNLVKPIIALGVLGLVMRRRARGGSRPWGILQTPHEWIMLAYGAYIVSTAPYGKSVFFEVFSLIVFFALAMHSITSEQRMDRVLRWWTYALMGVVIMGCGVVFGFDFTSSKPVTIENADRLSLNSWLLGNPNALGHTLASLVPILYFGFMRKGRMTEKLFMALAGAGALVCLWETKSKGAFLVTAGGIMLCLLIGRAWWWKVGVLAIAIGMGSTLVSKMPRMEGMASLRQDEGVVGRLLAWQMARGVTKSTLTGEGFKQFHPVIEWEGEEFVKATHSSYVKIGADLGSPGLLLYLSILCVCLRTLLLHPGHNPDMQRARNILLVLLLTFITSSWMIDRAYHTEFFVLAGVIGAYHRLSRAELKVPVARKMAIPAWSQDGNPSQALIPAIPLQSRTTLAQRLKHWHRYGLTDFLLAYCAMEATYWAWDYIIREL